LSIAFSLVIMAASPALAVDLDLSGTCPGPITMSISDAGPGVSVALLSANGTGVAAVPAGPCVGALLDLAPAGLTLRSTLRTDAAGGAVLTPSIPAPACSAWVQVLDLNSCELSPPLMLGDSGAGNTLLAADGRGRAGFGSGLYEIDLDSGAVTTINPAMDAPLTGLTYSPAGELWGVIASGYEGSADVVAVDPMTGSQRPLFSEPSLFAWSGFAFLPSGELYMWTENGDSLYQVDPASGGLTGPIVSGSSFGHCMAADDAGRLFRIYGTTLSQVDPVAGTERSLGDVSGLPYGTRGQGCAFHDGELFIAPFNEVADRVLYAVDVDAVSATSTGIVLPDGIDAIGAAW
jgi:hypothetical protein